MNVYTLKSYPRFGGGFVFHYQPNPEAGLVGMAIYTRRRRRTPPPSRGGTVTPQQAAAPMHEMRGWCGEQFGVAGERWSFRFGEKVQRGEPGGFYMFQTGNFRFADEADATAFKLRWM